jgi:hypothetical protein
MEDHFLSFAFALLGVSPLSAQQAQTSGDQSPAIVAKGNAVVNYGLTPEQVQELTKAAVAGSCGTIRNAPLKHSSLPVRGL